MDPEQVAAPVADDASAPAAAQAPRGLSAEPQQASAEEQKLYDTFVSKAFMLIYNEQMLPKIVEMLGGEGDPKEGLAQVSVMVIMRIMQMAEQAGTKIEGDVLFHGAKEIFEDLAELSRVSGVFDYSQDEDALEGAYFRALDQFRMALEGEGKVDRASAQADLAMLQDMDEAGELQGFFQSLAERDAPPARPETEQGGKPSGPQQDRPAPRRGGGLMPKGVF